VSELRFSDLSLVPMESQPVRREQMLFVVRSERAEAFAGGYRQWRTRERTFLDPLSVAPPRELRDQQRIDPNLAAVIVKARVWRPMSPTCLRFLQRKKVLSASAAIRELWQRPISLTWRHF
jgi:hypothetical protein